MSVVKLIDDYLLEFGNKRFLEGWDGAIGLVIERIEKYAGVDWRTKEELITALIKGEQK